MATNIKSYIQAGYPIIVLKTPEEDRALKLCYQIASSCGKDFAYWSLTKGYEQDIKSYEDMDSTALANEKRKETGVKQNIITDPIKALEEILKKNLPSNGMIYVLLDFHPFFKTPNIWRRLKDLAKLAKQTGISYVFVSYEIQVPVELKREVIIDTLPLPTREELLGKLKKLKKPIPENVENIVESALGLTLDEAENAFATSWCTKGYFDVREISKVKESIICSGGILECKSSNETLENIGGLKNFTKWAKNRLGAYSQEAKEYGIPAPKGALLMGVPGCGKSLSAKALSNLWQKPLLKLDIGKLFGSLVGETEANTRQALEIAEAMAPCILWIDEIEKGLAGLQSSGKTDSGVTSRAFGTILSWLQEKEAPVFVIATANNVSQLPPEFLRKGRFDEVFFVDIPTKEERKEIFAIQLKKYKRDASEFDIDSLAEASNQFTGAEIEQAIIDSLYDTWNSENKVLTTQSILSAISNINPMATSGSINEQIEAIRSWADGARIKKANGTDENVTMQHVGRVIIQEEK